MIAAVVKTDGLFLHLLATFLLAYIPERNAEIVCPDFVEIRAGTTAIVTCNITKNDLLKVYWFRGDTSLESPILRLENNQPGGTEYGKGQYNITSSGEMIIIDAKAKHEANYTTLVFLYDGTTESKNIKVNITVSPRPPCPVIDVCIPCRECILTVNDTGKLKCSINGAKPMIPLMWAIQTQNGISIVPHTTKIVKDPHHNTWNTSIEVSYGTSSCFQDAHIQCVAQDPFKLLEHSVSSIRMSTENCTDDNLKPERTVTVLALPVAISFVVALTAAVFFIYLFLRRRIAHREAQIFFSRLKKHYNSCSLLEPLTGGKEFDPDYEPDPDYVACQCEVTHSNGVTSIISTEILWQSNLFLDENCVFINGGISYWDFVFTKPFLHKWIQTDYKDFILFFIDRKELDSNIKLVDLLHEETSIEGDLIAKFIRKKKCIILLHGLEKIKYDGKETDQNQIEGLKNISAKKSIEDLTLSELSRSGHNANLHLKILITSYGGHSTCNAFPVSYTTIRLDNVDQRQLDELIEKIYKRSISEKGVQNVKMASDKNRKGRINTTYSKNIPPGTASQSESLALLSFGNGDQENKTWTKPNELEFIKDFLKASQLYIEFKGNPIALSVMAHIVISKYFSPSTDSVYINTPTREDIVCAVAEYLQHSFIKNKNDVPSDCDIVRSLGKLSLHLIDNGTKIFDMKTPVLVDYAGDLNLAIDMSLLQYSKHKIDNQDSGEVFQSPLQHYVEFSSSFFTYYFAAIYLIEDKLHDAQTMQTYGENFRLFEFLIHLVQSPIKHLFGVFKNFQNDDDVLDYLHKWDSQEGVTKVLKELQEKEIKISRLGTNDTEHEEAFATFCRKCCELEIKLTSITIIRNVSLKFMKSIDLPLLHEIIFYKMKINEELFLQTLKWLASTEIALRFLDCKVPSPLSKDLKMALRDLKTLKVKTVLQPDETKDVISVLNYHSGDWTKEER